MTEYSDACTVEVLFKSQASPTNITLGMRRSKIQARDLMELVHVVSSGVDSFKIKVIDVSYQRKPVKDVTFELSPIGTNRASQEVTVDIGTATRILVDDAEIIVSVQKSGLK